ncbi:hypothetical protein B0H13DRAFT_2342871 [Mycena leptocephala]|nr:hypothetical protein B0H13DRAFT_2342871 [Mycena leptocephala]
MFSNLKLATKLQSTYAHITLNWVTVAFFLLSLVHCCAQGIIQSFLFSLDSKFANLVTKVVHEAGIPTRNLTFLEGSSNHYTLRMCNDIPNGQKRYPCTIVFQSGVDVRNQPDAVESDTVESISILQDLTQGFSLSAIHDAAGDVSGVIFQSPTAASVFFSDQCTQILVYPQQVLQNSVREDMTTIFLQFWLMGISLFAVCRSSVPHLLTALGTRFLVASWSSYIAIYRTNNQATIFRQLVSAPGTPCGAELFPRYFGTRQAYDIADVVLNGTVLLISALLSWNLLRIYKAETFKHATHIYKYFMAVQAVLQLEVFVLVTAMSLWADILATTAIGLVSAHTSMYNALIFATAVLVLPWTALGWYGVRRERSKMMISFLAIACFFVIGWAIMFYSIVYRWALLQWPYLGCLTIASFILIFASIILGTICWRNFGLGLTEYLNAQDALASLNFAPELQAQRRRKVRALHHLG